MTVRYDISCGRLSPAFVPTKYSVPVAAVDAAIGEGFRTGAGHQRQRSWTSSILGVLEIVLGLAVLVWRNDFGPLFYTVVTVWAFGAAFVLLREALRQRSLANSKTG